MTPYRHLNSFNKQGNAALVWSETYNKLIHKYPGVKSVNLTYDSYILELEIEVADDFYYRMEALKAVADYVAYGDEEIQRSIQSQPKLKTSININEKT